MIAVPPRLGLQEALTVGRAINELVHADECVLDFSDMRFVEPFSLLYLSAHIRRLKMNHPTIRLLLKGAIPGTYAARMGFYRSFGAEVGNGTEKATGNATFLPLTTLAVADLRHEAVTRGLVVQEVVQRHAHQIARVLVQAQDGPLVDTLEYSLLEILRNAIEHSQSPIIEYCAQYWPTREQVQIAVLDEGIGLRASLIRNPYLEVPCDMDAIHLSLMPGISGKMHAGVRRRAYDDWQNSGFGLYMTSRLCGRGGSFFLASGEAGVLLCQAGKQSVAAGFRGTTLQLVLHTGRILHLSETLREFAREGDALARMLKGSAGVTASTASRMLKDAWS